jgi:tetratricopeptide (TPR) repeat protein
VSTGTFDADLARANLLRLRAEFRKAEDVCLNILRTYPNSAATHSLLGDIYSDQGRLEQAAEWYELSLDLDPNSLADRQKLDDIREQISERDHISAVAQLGLPMTKTANPTWTAVGLAMVVIMASVIGYAIRFGRINTPGKPEVINTPIRPVRTDLMPAVLPQDSSKLKPITPTIDPKITNSPVPPATAPPKDDNELKELVVQKAKWGPRLVSIKQDLVSKITTVVFAWPEGEDEHEIASDLAKTILEVTPDPDSIILRGTRADKLIYQVEVPRDKYAETQSDDWLQKNTAPDAWIAYVLTNELYGKAVTDAINAAQTAQANPTGDAPASSGSSAPPADEKPAKEGGN